MQHAIKSIPVIFLVTISFVQSSFGRIGESLRESNERYGSPSDERRLSDIWPAGSVGYVYHYKGVRIEAIFEDLNKFTKEHCIGLLFSATGRLNADEIRGLLEANCVGNTWQSTSTGLWVLSDNSAVAIELNGVLLLASPALFQTMREQGAQRHRSQFDGF